MLCPSCEMEDLKLVNSKKLKTKVFLCPNCNGIWLSHKQVHEVLGDMEEKLSLFNATKGHPVSCPECGAPLHARFFPYMEAEVGVCNECKGLWVNGRDLKKFFRAVPSLKAYGIPDHYRKQEGFLHRLKSKLIG